jgi:nucleoside-triphosphatase
MIFILTGDKDTGKTRFVLKLVTALKDQGYSIGGFLSIGKIVTDKPKEFDLLDLGNQKSWHLAGSEAQSGYVPCKRYFFNPATIRIGEEIVRESIRKNADLIVIDEIGRCELDGKIWDPLLRNALELPCNLLLITSNKNRNDVIRNYKLIQYKVIEISSVTFEQALLSISSQLYRTSHE